MCLVRKGLREHVRRVPINVGNIVLLLIDKTMFGLEKDVLYVSVYIPPEGSKYYNVMGLDGNGIYVLEDCILDNVLLDNDVYVLVNGDLNSRTANIAQPVSFKHDALYNLFDSDDGIERKSQDITVNSFGNSLLYMCTALDLCILNGTCEGDRLGAFTYISDSGSSVIDYFLMSCSLYASFFERCQLQVLERTESKHLPVRMNIEFPSKNANEGKKKETNLKKEKFVWDEDKINIFKKALTGNNFLTKFNDAVLSIDIDADIALNKFNECITFAAQCMKKTIVTDVNKTHNWFDQDCRTKRKEVRKLLSSYRKSIEQRDKITQSHQATRLESIPSETGIGKEEFDETEQLTNTDRHNYCVARREYKWLIKRKKNEFNNLMIQKLLSSINDQKEFWTNMRTIAPKRQHCRNEIRQESWFTHFKELLEQEDVLSGTAEVLAEGEEGVDMGFNRPITSEEVCFAMNKLKPNKAAGPDMIIGEIFKHACNELVPFFVKFFNRLFDNGFFPQNWTESIIIPLYKKGDMNDPGNYRGISLCDISSKIYGSIVNKRIQSWVDENNITGEIQAGFKTGYCTIDHVFTLMTCVQKRFCNNRNRKLYVAFIDFHKCFDTINRNILWPILMKNGIKGKLFNCIRSMYETVKARVRTANDTLTEQINCTLGVKQGDICSPVLFSLYINELAIDIIKNGRHGVVFDAFELFVLLFADDIVLCSETVVGLQNQLNSLHRAASRLHLTVNLAKSNIIVFRKGGYLGERERWFYNDKVMPVVNVYKYLGIYFSTKLSFSAACRDVASKAKRALLCIIQKLRQYNNSSINVFIKIFDAQIQPIMQYGSEIWGLGKEANECEKVHLYAMKKFLNVDMKTPNDLVYTEMCRHPITINSNINCVRYWTKLVRMENYKLPRKAYDVLYNLDRNGKENWATNVRICLMQNGFGYAWINQGVGNVKTFLAKLKERLIDCKWQQVNAHINDSDRFAFYSLICTKEKSLPCHLSIDIKRHLKCMLTKFRFGVSNINIHYFRYRNHTQRQLLCPYCKNVEENEVHFVLCCPLYECVRSQYIKEKYYRTPSAFKLRILMCSKNENVIADLCRFLYVAFNRRETFCS